MAPKREESDFFSLENTMADFRRRQKTYRERALKMYPKICARCGREFSGERLRELTVHHIDHDHDNNPPDGSNWELLCLYCHENEHLRYLDGETYGPETGRNQNPATAYTPLAGLKDLLKIENEDSEFD